MPTDPLAAPSEFAKRFLDLFMTSNRDLVQIQKAQGFPAMDVTPIGDGLLFRHPDFPSRSRVLGFGHEDLDYEKLVPEIEELFREQGLDGQVYLTPFAHPNAYKALGNRGWYPGLWQTALLRQLDPNEEFATPDERIQMLCGNEVSLDDWANTLAGGFSDYPVLEFDRPQTHHAFAELTKRRICLALWEREPAAAANWMVYDDLGFVMNAATRPEYRERGLHSALINYRLKKCAEEGCSYASYNAETGSRSQRNAQRHGFQPIYNYPTMVKKLT